MQAIYRRNLTPDGLEVKIDLACPLNMRKCGSESELFLLILPPLSPHSRLLLSRCCLPCIHPRYLQSFGLVSQPKANDLPIPPHYWLTQCSVFSSPLPPSPLSGCRLHSSGGCRGSQEAGADQGRETRTQLHDGHATHQEGVWVSVMWLSVSMRTGVGSLSFHNTLCFSFHFVIYFWLNCG